MPMEKPDADNALDDQADDINNRQLPILRYRLEILQALERHQTLVICGETGSGKSTQLPQMLWQAGYCQETASRYAIDLSSPPRYRIAHTQPRRVAAISLAKRIGDEIRASHPLHATEHTVGYKIRFEDKIAPNTAIKLMTDGVIIAETSNDRDLRQYSVVIIDEAHERSLNIDFLLGYLKPLLQRRSELRVIITSATLDAEKFATFFPNTPVITVEGRSYPVDIRYRPMERLLPTISGEDGKERDHEQGEQRQAWAEDRREEKLPKAIGAAVVELWQESLGDVLVFLPGEAEIRAVMEYLPGVLSRTRWSHAEILPLMSRLSSQEQMRIFHPVSTTPRIIIATNIAETSLTVPRIRFVIDSGLSRVLRYSPRMKLNRLEIEPIAQDSAKQRAGRCGRISAGICVRLYDEADFAGRPVQSTPEILRSSLSMVILRLLALRWGDVRTFPWIDSPSPRMIHHGLAELTDLQAINNQGNLTPLGEQMAKIAIDHTLSRMLLAAHQHRVLPLMLIIASALSTREVRELPMEAEERARIAHRQMDDARSDFITLINIWRKVEQARQDSTSHRDFRAWCKRHFLSWVRLREWRELHLQLQAQVNKIFPGARHGETEPISADKPIDEATLKSLHQAVLCGLPTQLGKKHDTEPFYQGPRGLKFFADKRWVNRKARWIVCGELLTTHRTIGRRIGKLEPAWIIETLPHLLDIKWLEPFWDKGQQAVMIHRQISLQGLVIEPRQRVPHHPQNEAEWEKAREVFIRSALIDGELSLPAPFNAFLSHNQQVLESLVEQENRARRPGYWVDADRVLVFYSKALLAVAPQAINARDFLRALRDGANQNPPALNHFQINLEDWKQKTGVGRLEDYPGEWVAGELRLPIRYSFSPGTAEDGMMITIDEEILPVLPRHLCDWLVPGLLGDKIAALIKTLPKRLRFALRDITPVFIQAQPAGNIPLIPALSKFCGEWLRQPVPINLFREEALPLHLKMRIRVVNAYGAVVLDTRNPAQIEAYLASKQTTTKSRKEISDEVSSRGIKSSAKPTNAALTPGVTSVEPLPAGVISSWEKTLGDFPRKVPIRLAGQTITGYAVLAEVGEQVQVQAFANESEALAEHAKGLVRLAQFDLAAQIKSFRQRAPSVISMNLPQGWFADDTAMQNAVVRSALSQVIAVDPLPDTAQGFAESVKSAKSRFLLIADSHFKLLREWALLYKQTMALVHKVSDQALRDDCLKTLASLYPAHFYESMPDAHRMHLSRYTQAVMVRLEKYPKNPARDQKNRAEINRLQRAVDEALEKFRLSMTQANELRWQLHELRVGLFAENLKTALPMSVKRFDKLLEEALGS